MKRILIAVVCAKVALLVVACQGPVSDAPVQLQTVTPESVGMSGQRLERLADLNQQYVDEGKLAGAMTMVARHGKVVHFSAAGTYGVNDQRPLTEDTLFRIYSMTKPVTAVALMMLYEEGAFQLSEPVSKFLPQLEEMQVWREGRLEEARNPITMRHLLTHTSGMSYGAGDNPVDQAYKDVDLLAASSLDELIGKVSALPLAFEPGERWHYSISYDVLGAVAEKISGQNYADFLRTRIFEPLEMNDTFFNVPVEKRERFPTNHVWDAEQDRLAAIGDDAPLNNSYTGEMFYSGGHGLVSTIGDYMKFAEMLRNGGSLNGVRLLSPKTIEYMTRNHLPAATYSAGTGGGESIASVDAWQQSGFGLGFGLILDPARAGVVSSPGTYFWGGYAGTIFWIDPREELVAIGMLQLLGSHWPYRREMAVGVYQAIEELNHGL